MAEELKRELTDEEIDSVDGGFLIRKKVPKHPHKYVTNSVGTDLLDPGVLADDSAAQGSGASAFE